MKAFIVGHLQPLFFFISEYGLVSSRFFLGQLLKVKFRSCVASYVTNRPTQRPLPPVHVAHRMEECKGVEDQAGIKEGHSSQRLAWENVEHT